MSEEYAYAFLSGLVSDYVIGDHPLEFLVGFDGGRPDISTTNKLREALSILGWRYAVAKLDKYLKERENTS